MALTNRRLKQLKCKYCKKKFQTYPKQGQEGLPQEIPFVNNGIIIVDTEEGREYYHGYPGRNDLCFEMAMKKQGVDTDAPKEYKFGRSI